MKKILIFAVSILVLFTFISADWLIKTKTHTDAASMMGRQQPAKDEVTKTWLGKEKMAMNANMGRIIFLFKQSRIIILNDNDKTYVETTWPLDLKKLLPPQAASMMDMMKMTLSITPGSETKQIGEWKCAKYTMNMSMSMMGMDMKFNSVIWATKDLAFDYQTLINLQQAVSQMGIITNPAEFKKIKGYPILSENVMEMMGTKIKSYSKVLSVNEQAAPPGTYDIPQGYKKSDKVKMKRGGF